MIHMHRKFNDAIFARFSVIMKNVVYNGNNNCIYISMKVNLCWKKGPHTFLSTPQNGAFLSLYWN